MDHYVDLKLLPDPEIAQPHLMGALFGKLHLALVAQRSEHIALEPVGAQDQHQRRVHLPGLLAQRGHRGAERQGDQHGDPQVDGADMHELAHLIHCAARRTAYQTAGTNHGHCAPFDKMMRLDVNLSLSY